MMRPSEIIHKRAAAHAHANEPWGTDELVLGILDYLDGTPERYTVDSRKFDKAAAKATRFVEYDLAGSGVPDRVRDLILDQVRALISTVRGDQ